MIVSLSNVGGYGVVKDLPDHDLPIEPLGWSDVINMRFKGGLAERAPGYLSAFVQPTQILYGLFSAKKIDGTNYIVGGGTTKVFAYSTDTEYEITGSTTPGSSADSRWTGGSLTGFLILNDGGAADPQFIAIEELGTATNLADLTNWPASTTCKVLRPFKYFLVAGGMIESGTTYPYKVRWSASAEPGTLPASWVASVSNDAGSVDLDSNEGPIVDMIPLGDQLAIYQEKAITLMRYVGGSDAANRLVMAFNRIPVGSTGGMINNNCGVDVAGVGHVVLSSSDVYVFNGSSIKSILDNRLRNWLFTNVDPQYKKRCFVLANVRDSEVMICFPEYGATACTKAITWNYTDNTLGIRDLPSATSGIYSEISVDNVVTWSNVEGTWSSITSTWESLNQLANSLPHTVLSGTSQRLYVLGRGYSNDGFELNAELRRSYIAVGDAQRVKFFRSVWPRFDLAEDQNIYVSIGTSMSVNEEPVWQPEIVFDGGTSRAVYVNRSGRFLGLRIRSNDGQPWRIKSLDVDVQPQGMY